MYCTTHEEGCDTTVPRNKECRFIKKEIGVMFGRGENCTCPDCPVLYGGECYTTEENNKKLEALTTPS